MKKILTLLISFFLFSSTAWSELVEIPASKEGDAWKFSLNDSKCVYRMPRFFVCSKGEDVEWDIILPGKGKEQASGESLFVFQASKKLLIQRLIQDFSVEQQQLVLFNLQEKKIEWTKTADAPLSKIQSKSPKEVKFSFGSEEVTLP